MKLSLGTAGPPFVILATAIGLLYFYMGPPVGPPATKPIGLEVTEAMLSPKLEPLPARNPFRLVNEVEPKSQGFGSVPAAKPDPWAVKEVKPSAAVAAAAASAKKAATPPGPPPSRIADAFVKKLEGWARAVNKQAEQAKRVQADLKAKVEGKANLSATSINARGKIAIINNKSYAEGDAIDWAAGIGGPIVVAEIRAASVLLRTQGANHEVLFPHSSKPTTAAPTVAANATKKPKAARKPAGSAVTKPR